MAKAAMSRARMVVLLVLVALLLILTVQNTQVVGIRVLFWQLQMSRVVLILLSAVAGFVAGYLTPRLRKR